MPSDPPSPRAYELAPQFPVRMAGVPFDVLEPVATPRAIAIAREMGAGEEALERLAAAALDALARDRTGSRNRIADATRLVRKRMRLAKVPPGSGPEVRAYAEAADALDRLRAAHADALGAELERGFRALRRAALGFLPSYALFASPTVEELALDITPDGEWTASRLKDGGRDRTLLMYVQRLATKNETVSVYGPMSWGSVDPALRGVRIEPGPGLRRRVFLERWVADAVVAAMNADPAVRPEIAPRLHPHARIDADAVLRLDSGARLPLDPADRALLARVDGESPAHALGDEARLARLADGGAVLWAAECPAYVLDRIGALRARVERWREGEPRRRWLPALTALAAIPEAFAREADPAARRELLGRARALLAETGAAPSGSPGVGKRVLYRGANVLGEKCARPPAFRLGAAEAREIAERAAPWFDLWRDTYAFAAHRVNAKLAQLHAALAPGGGPVPLPSFLRAAEAAGLPLAGIGIPALAHLAWREVRAAFREELEGRREARAVELSAHDCAVVRRRFQFPRFDALTYPSADLQLAAATEADVAAGKRRWVVAELHLAGALLQHGFAFAAPDPDAFGAAVHRAAGTLCDWGLPTDDLSHTMLDLRPVQDLFTYVGPSAAPREWRTFRPAEAEVVVAADGDVRIRAGGEERGSFARSWVLGFGFHPFVFPLGDHSPRLEVGGVVVQRESWIVRAADLPRAPYRNRSPEIAIDLDRLRSARGIPRFVYVRPTETAVRRLGAGGRDKDAKPIFVDLESHPFLDVLARWMERHGELDVAEMLPAPDELLWREEGGRRTFELRTLVLPAR
ncbi:MAG TPA: hypothetical protein VIV57_21045 [Anaeromyxobacter sp.]